MAQPPVAAGSIVACFRKITIALRFGNLTIISVMVGASAGPMMYASFTTAAQHVRMAVPGASVKSWFGGMKKSRNGLESTHPISTGRSDQTISLRMAQQEQTDWRE